ncbi:hypothetical protein FBZ88_1012 [Nitrospirillum bahiense]|uniref:Uncharacterized protein n=1 Tax=Nitrospirillum amazonense TaxID=28077 RepID=A0A560GCI5_9PROT|nr:hypothetical protein FBZ88_1012 [Nitrospirillum amazonense]
MSRKFKERLIGFGTPCLVLWYNYKVIPQQ